MVEATISRNLTGLFPTLRKKNCHDNKKKSFPHFQSRKLDLYTTFIHKLTNKLFIVSIIKCKQCPPQKFERIIENCFIHQRYSKLIPIGSIHNGSAG